MSHRHPSLLMMMIIIIVIIVVAVSGLLSSPIAHYDPTKIEFLRKNESTKKRERCIFSFLFVLSFLPKRKQRDCIRREERVE